jgi:probable HAF family extracellular repeat protein
MAACILLAIGLVPARSALAQSLTGLGTLPGNNMTQARGVSADGSVVVGISGTDHNYWRAFRWTRGDGMEDLAPGAPFTFAEAISANGNVIVGIGTGAGTTDNRPAAWCASTSCRGRSTARHTP